MKLTARQQAERVSKLRDWLAGGGSIAGFAAQIDRDPSTVRKFMKTHGIKAPSK